jgi:hypothetical protein
LRDQLQQQRQSAEQAQLHGYIDSIPNLSPAQRHWLHSNPHGVYRFDLLHGAHVIAGQRGIPVDSPEYFHFLDTMLRTYGHLPPQQPAQPAPAPSPPPMPPPVAHVDIESHDTEPESTPMDFVSAPVSRGEASHAMSGEPQPLSPSQVRLTPEQREVARLSMPHLSHDEAEKTYAAGLLKQEKMKRSGLIK